MLSGRYCVDWGNEYWQIDGRNNHSCWIDLSVSSWWTGCNVESLFLALVKNNGFDSRGFPHTVPLDNLNLEPPNHVGSNNQ